MEIDKILIAAPGEKLHLDKLDTAYIGQMKKDDALQQAVEDTERLSGLQERLYASARYSVLIIFQAMDAAGKDSTIKHVMSGINPQGCRVTSFKQPSSEELRHDFLWRTYKCMPERGMIGIFNRSYYEEVLVTKVHPELILGQDIPGIHSAGDVNDKLFEKRYRTINDMERHLTENGTIILKFFLHLSKDEQKKRFLSRIDTPRKNWKFSMADVAERQHWDDYQKAYTDCIEATSTKEAPWYIIPADKKWYMRSAVSSIIINRLEALGLDFPHVGEDFIAKLDEAKMALMSEK